jgi:hypothetical protein
MKLPPPVDLPEGGTPAERLDMVFCQVLTVSKADILKAEGCESRTRERSVTHRAYKICFDGKPQPARRTPGTIQSRQATIRSSSCTFSQGASSGNRDFGSHAVCAQTANASFKPIRFNPPPLFPAPRRRPFP